MTNPTNAVEKPATGCGCRAQITPGDLGRMCPEAKRIAKKMSDALFRNAHTNEAHQQAYQEWLDARSEFQAHVEASNG